MEKSFQRPCPVCGAPAGPHLAGLDFAVFDDETLPGRLDLVTCRDCGHCFCDGRLDQAQVDEHYRRNRYLAASQTPGAGGDSEPDRRHQRQIIERLRRLAPFGAGPGFTFDQPIYDVGCGRGGLLKTLAGAGFRQALGVELLSEAVEMIRAGGLAALEGSALNLPASGPAPGLVIYSHIFEHLPAPIEALDEARRRLAPGGLIYIEVPDASRYESSVPWRALYQEHLSHFGPSDLERLLVRAGFKIMALERGSFPLAGGRSEGVVWAVATPVDGPESGSPQLEPERALCGHEPREEAGETANALRRYLQACSRHPLTARLAALADSGRPLKVWGLSQMTLLLLGSSPLGRADLRGFIDSDPSKRCRRLWGRVVEGPDSLTGDSAGVSLLLAAWGREEEMLAALKRMGFKGRVHTLSGGDEALILNGEEMGRCPKPRKGEIPP